MLLEGNPWTIAQQAVCFQGVMLSHANLDYQRRNMSFYVQPTPGQRALALLPPWHIYERSCAYFLFSRACQMTYTNIRCALPAVVLAEGSFTDTGRHALQLGLTALGSAWINEQSSTKHSSATQVMCSAHAGFAHALRPQGCKHNLACLLLAGVRGSAWSRALAFCCSDVSRSAHDALMRQ